MNHKNKICIVTTLRTTLQETQDFINYHINIGIDHIFLFFDNPNDNAIVKSKSPFTTCIKCDTNHWRSINCSPLTPIEIRQEGNANLALNWAKEKGFDWIAHIDSDELIFANKPLKSRLKNIEKSIDYIQLPTKEAVPEKIDYEKPYREITLFKSLPNKNAQFYNNSLPKDLFFNGEYFRGHTTGKSITRISNNIKSLKIHSPIFFDQNKVKIKTARNISLLHFDCYSYNNWKNKWQRRINKKVIVMECRKNRLEQREFFKSAADSDAMIETYKQLYFINDTSKTQLFNKKMLVKIKIKKKLFSPKMQIILLQLLQKIYCEKN